MLFLRGRDGVLAIHHETIPVPNKAAHSSTASAINKYTKRTPPPGEIHITDQDARYMPAVPDVVRVIRQ
jgi:hypothetical protein